jgi:pimeloyl-ACP methyl ester carboxylesterase
MSFMPKVLVSDVDLYYELIGKGAPVLLVPGLGADVGAFRTVIEGLAARCRVLAFDPRGAGQSDKPETPYSIGMLANDAAALMRAVGQPPSTVVGVSMGGRVALEMALRHDKQVRRLVLVSTGARSVPYRRSTWPLVVLDTLRGLPKPDPPLPRALERQLEASRTYDGRSRLGEIRAPTLILHGRGDRVIPYRLARELRAGIRGSRLITVRGGHLVFMTRQSSRLVAEVLNFAA